MVSRLARELGAARRRDLQYRTELEHRVEQLQSAYRTQEKLLATIRELSSPVLEPFEGIVLLPIAGALDASRIAHVMPALLERVAAKRPAAVIIHVTLAESFTPDAAALVLRAEQSVRHFGVRLILSGVPAEIMRGPGAGVAPIATNIDISRVTLCSDLEDALITAFDLLGYRFAR
jgi:rsbT co-antagonist protein RsbR